MDWSASTWWWVATGVLVGAELVTGTFYLLMLALGTAAAALAAHAGLGHNAQLVAAALVGGGAVALWHLRRSRTPHVPVEANRDVNLDVGEQVRVAEWGPDGVAQVHYRGAPWAARWAGSGSPGPGLHVIRAVQGNQLQLDKA